MRRPRVHARIKAACGGGFIFEGPRRRDTFAGTRGLSFPSPSCHRVPNPLGVAVFIRFSAFRPLPVPPFPYPLACISPSERKCVTLMHRLPADGLFLSRGSADKTLSRDGEPRESLRERRCNLFGCSNKLPPCGVAGSGEVSFFSVSAIDSFNGSPKLNGPPDRVLSVPTRRYPACRVYPPSL